MDAFKTAVSSYVRRRDEQIAAAIAQRFGVPLEEVKTIPGLMDDVFKGIETNKKEYRRADAAFRPAFATPRVLGPTGAECRFQGICIYHNTQDLSAL